MKIGVLGSGKGSNFDAIYRAVKEGVLDVEIAVVISDIPGSLILKNAKSYGIKAVHIDPGKYKTWIEPAVEEKYAGVLKENGVDLVVLAGFMRVIKAPLLDAFPGRVINIHPSLLPSFRGLKAWEQALNYGVKHAGCTVHFVDKDIDAGPIILQAVVPVMDDDTPETLHARIQVEEHKIYPRAIGLIAHDKLRISGKRVLIKK